MAVVVYQLHKRRRGGISHMKVDVHIHVQVLIECFETKC